MWSFDSPCHCQLYSQIVRSWILHCNARNAAKFKEGDLVTIKISKIDRTSTDMPGLPCLVVELRGKAQESYHLR